MFGIRARGGQRRPNKSTTLAGLRGGRPRRDTVLTRQDIGTVPSVSVTTAATPMVAERPSRGFRGRCPRRVRGQAPHNMTRATWPAPWQAHVALGLVAGEGFEPP